MEKRRLLIAVFLLIGVIPVIAILWGTSRRQSTVRPVPIKRAAAPAARTTPAKPIITLPDRKAAARTTLHCLNALCETGASDAAVTETQSLVARLEATRQPFAQHLSGLLKRDLTFLHGVARTDRTVPVAAPPVAFPGVPADLIDRAAAACDARGRRQPGEIVLSFAGDCTFGTVNGDGGAGRFPSVYRRSGRVDYPFDLVKPWFLNDDMTVVNFECTLTDAARMADKQWHFKGPSRYAAILPAGSVEAAGLANNHSFDYLQAGFHDTVVSFGKAHVPVFYKNAPDITTVHGVQVVLIGDCTVVGENTTVIDGVPGRVLREIKRDKKPGNIVIVMMHWGRERATVPAPWQQALGRKFIEAGADAVVGAHPHVVQGLELYKGRYIAYSLGNFAFGGNSLAPYPETFILRLRFHVRDGKTSLRAATVVPCWITSSPERTAAGILRNNYQPKPVFGRTADRVVALIRGRCAKLEYGVKTIPFLRLP